MRDSSNPRVAVGELYEPFIHKAPCGGAQRPCPAAAQGQAREDDGQQVPAAAVHITVISEKTQRDEHEKRQILTTSR